MSDHIRDTVRIKIELHTADGQVFHAAVVDYPQIGELVVSEQGSRFIIGDKGHGCQNYPYRMYKVKPLTKDRQAGYAPSLSGIPSLTEL